MTHKIPLFATTISLLMASACEVDDENDTLATEAAPDDATTLRSLSPAELVNRANAIKAAHAAHPLINNPVIFAGIANAETQMSHCYAEYDLGGCPSQFTSADCGGGVILAGGADGPCPNHQGGLGMFQFDQGSETQTYNYWLSGGYWPIGNPASRNVVTLDGNIQASIDFVLYKAWNSNQTPYFASYQVMYDWINSIRPVSGDSDFEIWLNFLAHNYNGWDVGTSGWYTAKEKYRNNTISIYNDLGGWDFWYGGGGSTPPPCSPEGGLWCGGNGVSGDSSTLYACKNGALVVKEVCANGCYAAPSGSPDSCYQPNPADLDCSCPNGKYHNGDTIPTELTYCGMRVCGMDGNVWECRTSNAWEQTGLTCGAGNCSCANGSHLDGTKILTQHTECHFQVCGGGNTWYTCEPEGWSAVSGSYCTMGPTSSPDSCVGNCGGNAGNCWCDSYCANYGDCCADKVAVCG